MRRTGTGTAVALCLGLVVVAAPGGTAAEPVDPERAALEHVRAGGLGLAAADVDELEVTDRHTAAHTGATHVYLRQQKDGLDVLGAEATVNVGRDGRVVHSGSRLLAGLDEVATGSVRLDAAAAFAAAAEGLGLAAPRDVRVLSAPAGADRATVLTDGGVAAKPVRAHLAYQGLDDGTARLAWVLDLELPTYDHWWIASVDAADGRLLRTVDLVVSEHAEDTHAALARPADFRVGAPEAAAGLAEHVGHAHEEEAHEQEAHAGEAQRGDTTDGAEYTVFQMPLESPQDGPRTVVKDPADARFSPFGWHDTDGKPGAESTLTTGNNVQAYGDTVNDDLPDPDSLVRPDGGAALKFDNPFNPADRTALENRPAAITNLFYWNNTIHDVLAGYGFTEDAGNFQTTNYTGQGRGGDAVKAQAQDGSGTNNANFATPAEGSQPRMQMFLWSTAAQTRQQVIDGDFDAGVIAHEYGHGVSNRLTGGPSNVSCLRNQEQMGEGWSDYFGYVLTMREGDRGETARGIGTYVLDQGKREAKGIRPTPYSTDMAINPATYKTIVTAAAPHGVGYVWATMLYDMYWGLVDDHGFNPDLAAGWTTGGNNLAVQLVMDGMKFQPCNPGFVDGRDAILQADQALTGGENSCTIWRAFARRGLGVSAAQGATTSKTDGTEAFDLPAACA